jgi:hypothetical protein
MDRTGTIPSIIAYSLDKKCPEGCFPATAVALLLVHTAASCQWVYLSQPVNFIFLIYRHLQENINRIAQWYSALLFLSVNDRRVTLQSMQQRMTKGLILVFEKAGKSLLLILMSTI